MKAEQALAELTTFYYTQESLSGLGSNFSAMIQAQADEKNYVPKNFSKGSNQTVNDLDSKVAGLIDSQQLKQHRKVYNKLQQLELHNLVTLSHYFQTETLPVPYRIAYQEQRTDNTLETLAGLVHTTKTAISQADLTKVSPKAVCHQLMIPFGKPELILKAQIMTEAKESLRVALEAYQDIPEASKRLKAPKPKPKLVSSKQHLKELTALIKELL